MRQLLQFPLILSLALGASLSACTDDTVSYDPNDSTDPQTPPEEDTRPIAGQSRTGTLGLFPTDLYTVADDTRLTGRTVTFNYQSFESSPGWIAVKRSLANQIEGLDGFGTSAGAWISFRTRIEKDADRINQNTFMGYQEGEQLQLLPIQVTPGTDQITIRPDIPIPPNREAFYLTTTALRDIDGNQVIQDPTLTAILAEENKDGADEYDAALQERIRKTAQQLVEQEVVASTDDIAALAVFTTQSIYETDLEIAEYIRNLNGQNTYAPNPVPNNDCEVVFGEPFRLCTFSFEIPNFIEEDRTIRDDAVDHVKPNYTLTGYAFLPLKDPALEAQFDVPLDPERGYAVNIFGHGLGGNALGARDIARHTAQQGLATLAIDAPVHGGHPLRPEDVDPDNELSVIMALFGLSVDGSKVEADTRVLRDGWRNSNFDKLALIEALKEGLDLDGDGAVDLDIERLTYLGGSLGAIQGAEFAALTDVPRANLFAVAGGRLSDIVRYGTLFKLVNTLLFPNQKEDSLMRAFVMLQTSIEKGDGVNWAYHVLNDRLQSGDGYLNQYIPDVAIQISVPDDIVPEQSGMALARAMGVQGIGAEVLADPLISFDDLTLHQNHATGATAGILQTDCVRRRDPTDPWISSEHGKSADSVEGIKYWTDALMSIFGHGVTPGTRMTLKDPYTELGIIRGESCEDTTIE